jgi:dCMP deaminase
MHAARIGVSLRGCSAYVTWPPCTRCARSLVQAGVSRILYPAELVIPERWQDDFLMSTSLFREVGIEVVTVPMPVESLAGETIR